MAKARLSGTLAVILHADVAGSTALVQQDKELAHERIHEAFQLFSGIVKTHAGHILEIRGDALLAEFNRAADAVSAALSFQAAHAERLQRLGDDLRPAIRIGITMGEVVIADNTVTGAGVVQAQRIEQLAQPGGVCISAPIHDALSQRMPFDYDSLGERELKGFDDPVRIYRVSLRAGAEIPRGGTRDGRPAARARYLATAALVAVLCIIALAWLKPWAPAVESQSQIASTEIGQKPSIAVLAFDNMSGDPEQEHISDGIAEDIITDLSQLHELAVIARNSSFSYKGNPTPVQQIGKELNARYLVEGSVRKSANQIRITAQLIDTGNGHHLWAERYDRELTDAFKVLDEITQRIVAALSIKLTGSEQQQLAHHATDDFEAYELFQQGRRFVSTYTEEGFSRGKQMFERAIALDPDFARAYGGLAVAMMRQIIAGYVDDPAEARQRALELAKKAVSIYPDSPEVQWALGYIHMYLVQYDDAVAALQRAVELSPSFADGHALLALIRNNQGRAAEAIELIEKAIALNPHYSWDYLYNLGRAHYALGNYQQAADYLGSALQRNESPLHPRVFLIASYVQLGRQDDAEWEVDELSLQYPESTISHLQNTTPITDAALLEKLLQDLRTAGVPE